MPHLEEPGRRDVIAPGVVIQKTAIAVAAQAFLVLVGIVVPGAVPIAFGKPIVMRDRHF